MKYKEIHNPIHPGQSSGNFNEPNPGELISVWIDSDLQSNDYPDTTVLFQLVFEILEPEGALLCFLESHEFFEFILDDDFINFEFAEIIISDDCYQGFSIILETTATENPTASGIELLKDVFLTSTGTIAFTSNFDQELSISLSDMSGKVISTFAKKGYGDGRHTLNCNSMTSGTYVFKVVAENGEEDVVKMFAY
ncbi:MAG: T9SS type A sorting domain-containing protein [Saprospiraceae bacterium]|nr:T9SS type A sorting domain-containing protein [Saprospiraceae bacterium]